MNADRSATDALADGLRRHGLEGPALFLLEAIGPLAVLGAQAAYLLEPFFGPGGRVRDVARLLENEQERTHFLNRLREGGKR